MAETGIMGSSGDFRTNQTSAKNTAGELASKAGNAVGNIFSRSSEQRRQISHEQFLAAAKIHGIKVQGKTTIKVMRAAGELQTGIMSHAKKTGMESVSANLQTGEMSAKTRAPRVRSAAPAAGPAAPATTRMPTKYSARNPHPKNPFEAGTKEHKGYNSATGSQRAAMTRRSKQGMK
jgi:hypothetical protein